jgi:CRISPR-associated protein (TIGR02584 family)
MGLDDLRTSALNELAGNVIVARVYEWTRHDEVILHASLAGGRKTMGFYLARAMSWFARPLERGLFKPLNLNKFRSLTLTLSHRERGYKGISRTAS